MKGYFPVSHRPRAVQAATKLTVAREAVGKVVRGAGCQAHGALQPAAARGDSEVQVQFALQAARRVRLYVHGGLTPIGRTV